MEDEPWWKTTFDRRQPLREDDLWWKTTFDGRRHLMEDDLWWKTTFDGIRPLMEDDIWWKMTFDGRRPSTEDDIWRKTAWNKPVILAWASTLHGSPTMAISWPEFFIYERYHLPKSYKQRQKFNSPNKKLGLNYTKLRIANASSFQAWTTYNTPMYCQLYTTVSRFLIWLHTNTN